MSQFKFVTENVNGTDNVFAHILTRWARGYRTEKMETGKVKAITYGTPAALDKPEWPDILEIQSIQIESEEKPNDLESGDDGLWKRSGRTWITDKAVELQMKLIIISHCGQNGHRGTDETYSIISEEFIWTNMYKDIRAFFNGCIHCVVSRTGEIIPRRLASTLHGSTPNEVVHMDFLYIDAAVGSDMKYVLIIRDDLSGYVWLWPTSSATSDSATEALATWIGNFGSMDWLVTDQGSHFTATLMSNITEDFKLSHHFTIPYCPWANGTVERECRGVIGENTAILSEVKLPPENWPGIVECVQSVLNHAPLKTLGRRTEKDSTIFRTPLEVFTSHKPKRPLLRAVPLSEYKSTGIVTELRAQQLIQIERT